MLCLLIQDTRKDRAKISAKSYKCTRLQRGRFPDDASLEFKPTPNPFQLTFGVELLVCVFVCERRILVSSLEFAGVFADVPNRVDEVFEFAIGHGRMKRDPNPAGLVGEVTTVNGIGNGLRSGWVNM